MNRLVVAILLVLSGQLVFGQSHLAKKLPVRGLCISAPTPSNVDSFVTFMKQELRPRRVNTIILRIDYRYKFETHPELSDSLALSKEEVEKLVHAAHQCHINLIPQINFLGHQSWANHVGKLLTVYPQFDETPWLTIPAQYSWPNADSLYCKSYCPLNPDLHKVIFDVMDEICEVFQSNVFHAGMDEVFILGDSKCPRCNGKTKAALFAGEVTLLHDHLAEKGRALWIWGDRLIDGYKTGVGMWEGSYNQTSEAVDMIPKDVVICDWHYDHADKTAPYFVNKGFSVITCPWRKPVVAATQLTDLVQFRKQANRHIRKRYLGIMETVWSSTSAFFNGYYQKEPLQPASSESEENNTAWKTFHAIFN